MLVQNISVIKLIGYWTSVSKRFPWALVTVDYIGGGFEYVNGPILGFKRSIQNSRPLIRSSLLDVLLKMTTKNKIWKGGEVWAA